jgi:hypothetical protein
VPVRPAVPSEAKVREYLKTLSNWGRWGSEDELGTINLITAAKRQAAARLVTHGESVSCARPISTEITADTTVQPMRFMGDSGEGRDTVSAERALQRRGAAEFIGMVFHGYTITHVDAPSHYFWDAELPVHPAQCRIRAGVLTPFPIRPMRRDYAARRRLW